MDFGEIDAASGAFDAVVLLMSALRALHLPLIAALLIRDPWPDPILQGLVQPGFAVPDAGAAGTGRK